MRKVLFLFIVLLFSVCYAAGTAETTTLMVYLCGSNLESLYGSATKDLQEMMLSQADLDQTHIYIFAGGSNAWRNNSVNENRGGLYSLTYKKHDRTMKLNALETGISGMNMGDDETLSYFLNYCRQASETDRYALILWDHGGGPVNGVCWDEKHQADHLTLEEIMTALAQTPFQENPLEWIGFDACLMSSVEVASKLAPYARYMISSQAEEPESGWNYSFLKGLENDADGAETGRRIIDAYFAVPPKTASDLTMSCIDLSRVKDIETSMDSMFSEIAGKINEEYFSRIAKMRIHATGFGKSAKEARDSGSYDLVDIVSLSDSYAGENPAGAEAIRNAVNSAVVENRSNVPDSCGLSVYHPYRNQAKYTDEWKNAYTKLDFCSGYTTYVNSYGAIMSGNQLTGWGNLENIHASTNEGQTLATLELTPEQTENLASARLIILARNLYDTIDDSFVQVYSTASVHLDGTQLSAFYDGKTLQATDETGADILTGAISYTTTEDGLILVSMYPCRTEENYGEWPEHPLLAEYYIPEGTEMPVLKGYAVYDDLLGKYTHREELDWSEYDAVAFLNHYRNIPEYGVSGCPAFSEWPEDLHTNMQLAAVQGILTTRFLMTFSLELSKGEDLFAAFEITDTQGNVYTSAMTPLDDRQVLREHIEEEAFYANREHKISVSARTDWEAHQIQLFMEITNDSWMDPEYELRDLLLNGQPVEPTITWMKNEKTGVLTEEPIGLADNETLKFCITLDQDILARFDPDGRLESLKGTLYTHNKWGETSKQGIAVFPDLPLAYVFHDTEKPKQEDVSFTPDASVPNELSELGKFSADLIVRAGEESGSGTVILSVSLENESAGDLFISIQCPRINYYSAFSGYPVKDYYTAYGHGSSIENWPEDGGKMENHNASEWFDPGETGVANYTFSFNVDQHQFGLEDVSLFEVSFLLHIFEDEEQSRQIAILPVTLTPTISLNALHSDTEKLPSQELVDAVLWGDRSTYVSKPLFSGEGYSVSLEAIYLCGQTPVLELSGKNQSDRTWVFCMGDATINGLKSEIGQSVRSFVRYHNNQNNVFHLNREPWPEEKSAVMVLKPGADQTHFISLAPVENIPETLQSITFHALTYAEETPVKDYFYYDAAEIFIPNGGILLTADEESVTLANQCEVRPGEPMPKENEITVQMEAGERPVPEAAVDLYFSGSPELEMKEVAYWLFRKYRSEAEMAAVNVFQTSISFYDHEGWMILEAIGFLNIAEDNHSAYGQFPGYLPRLRTWDGYTPLPVMQISQKAHDLTGELQPIFAFRQFVCSISEDSFRYAEGYIHTEVEDLTVYCDLQNGETSLSSWDYGTEIGYPSLVDSAFIGIYPVIPSDITDPQEVYDHIFSDTGSSFQASFVRLEEPAIRIRLDRIANPEDYMIVFRYRLPDESTYFTVPQPLTDFTNK